MQNFLKGHEMGMVVTLALKLGILRADLGSTTFWVCNLRQVM